MSLSRSQTGIALLQQALPGAADARTLVIAGSGLGGFVKSVEISSEISYGHIPGIGDSTVAGHSGRLIFGHVGSAKTPALIMAGRRHLYEGLDASQAVLLPRLILNAWPQIKSVFVSNAAGGLSPTFAVGDLMLITDHINWMFRSPFTGSAALPAPCSEVRHQPVHDPKLRQLALDTALELGVNLKQGTYLAMMGPSYETRAEVLMIRHIFGAHAVGMSTVPESILASAMGRRVLGISFISNMLVDPVPVTHEEVVENSALVEDKFSRLISRMLEKVHSH